MNTCIVDPISFIKKEKAKLSGRKQKAECKGDRWNHKHQYSNLKLAKRNDKLLDGST